MAVKPEELRVGQVISYAKRGRVRYMRIIAIDPWPWPDRREGQPCIAGKQVVRDGRPDRRAKWPAGCFVDQVLAIVKQPEEAKS